MKNMPIYEALAQAFAAEGVAAHFTLMGDGNMHLGDGEVRGRGADQRQIVQSGARPAAVRRRSPSTRRGVGRGHGKM
jgi:hypothetical protein